MKYTRALAAADGNKAAAARAMGVAHQSFTGGLLREQARMARTPAAVREAQEEADVKQIQLPEFPNPDAPIEELMAARMRQFERTKLRKEAEDWFTVRVNDPKPIGIMWFGDPHIDDDGCNLPLLRQHAKIAATEPGLYAANIGDTTNNWSGRLVHLYAKQDTSKKTARRYAKWFLGSGKDDAQIPWIVWLMGNHDLWGDGADVLRLMNVHNRVPMLDWSARFKLVFPNGAERKVHTAHNFKGHSMWHPGHGHIKAARFESDADLFIDGHLHNWFVHQFEMAGQCRAPVFARARGYKWFDDYATQLGHYSQRNGAAILTVFNPHVEGAGRCTAFADVEQGLDTLRAIRNRPAPRASHPVKTPKRAPPKKPKSKRRTRGR